MKINTQNNYINNINKNTNQNQNFGGFKFKQIFEDTFISKKRISKYKQKRIKRTITGIITAIASTVGITYITTTGGIVQTKNLNLKEAPPPTPKAMETMEQDKIDFPINNITFVEDLFPNPSKEINNNQGAKEEIKEIENINYSYSIETPENIKNILNTNETLNEAYTQLTDSIKRFSDQLGEDGLKLIKKRVAEIGDNKITTLDVLKVLWIESKGYIYSKDNPDEIITSYTGKAFGPFQLTYDSLDFLNQYYKFEEKNKTLDILNPYDNLDACIYQLKFLHDKRSDDIKQGKELPTGNNIKHAMMWSYHDGAWASALSKEAENYLQKFDFLSEIDKYPEVVEHLIK